MFSTNNYILVNCPYCEGIGYKKNKKCSNCSFGYNLFCANCGLRRPCKYEQKYMDGSCDGPKYIDINKLPNKAFIVSI